MRTSTFLLGAVVAMWPTWAQAHPFEVLAITQDPEPEMPAEEPTFEPTSSKAPDSGEPPPDRDAASEAKTSPAVEADENATLEKERGKARSKAFNKHGVGVRGGITVVPTWILSRYLDAHANALCRGEKIGNFAEKKGLLKTDGCNFYIGGEYVYRQSRILDIVGVIGYQHLHTPDGYWLDKGQFALNGVGGADYTEVKMGLLVLEADFIARAPIIVTDDVEFGIGGGGGIGLGVVFGGLWQTALGDNPQGYDNGMVTDDTCQEIRDLADFRRCTPRYDPTEDEDMVPPDPDELSDPNPMLFANCGRDACNINDLKRLGYRDKNDDIPPVIPIVNLVISTRVIIKDVFGITLSGGWNTGFYFGGSLNYFFGKQFAKDDNTGPAPSARTKVHRPTLSRTGGRFGF